MVVETLLAKIPTLVKLGQKLLFEREKGRKKFLDQVIEPLNEVFSQLVSEHMATFSQLDSALSKTHVDRRQLRELLDHNILFESATVNLLGELTGSRMFTEVPQSGLKDSFEAYIQEIASCLLLGVGDRPRFTFAYYSTLSELLRSFVEADGDPKALRTDIRALIARFTSYQAKVARAYLEVKRASLE